MSKTEINDRKVFSISISLFVALLITGVLITSLYFIFPSNREELRFFASIIGGMSALYAAFYAAESLRLNVISNKQKNSFELLKGLREYDIIRVRGRLDREFNHNDISPSDMYDAITSDSEFHTAVKSLLTMFSDIAIAIKHGYADEIILHNSVDTLLPYTYERFKPYVEAVREKRKDQRIYHTLEKLVNSWNGGHYFYSNSEINNENVQ